MTKNSHVDVVIVGGGISGLAAAYELQQRGLRFELLEASNRLGGVILTETIDGFTIDAGPDALLVQKPAGLKLCAELGLQSRLQSTLEPRTAFILRNDVLHALPEASILGIPTRIAPFISTGLFSLMGKLRFSLDLILPRGSYGTENDESIASFFTRRFGRESVDYLAEPLLGGIHAGNVERLSMRALFPRFLEAEDRHRSLILGFRQQAKKASGNGAFRSLPGGLEQLVHTLVDELPQEHLHQQNRVVRVEGSQPYVVHCESGKTIQARTVILAIPAEHVATLVAQFNSKLAELCREIPHVSTATIALGYRRQAIGHPLKGNGFVVPRVERDTRITAASWVSSKWPGRAPRGQVLLRAFLGGSRDSTVLAQPNTELIRIAHADLARLLKIDEEPRLSKVYRWKRSTPQHEVGHLSRMEQIELQLQEYPGLYLTGSSFRGAGIADCIANARATAKRMAEEIELYPSDEI
jgi:oxygen-dependent protoporphyrinogen oxidase